MRRLKLQSRRVPGGGFNINLCNLNNARYTGGRGGQRGSSEPAHSFGPAMAHHLINFTRCWQKMPVVNHKDKTRPSGMGWDGMEWSGVGKIRVGSVAKQSQGLARSSFQSKLVFGFGALSLIEFGFDSDRIGSVLVLFAWVHS